MKKLIYIMFIIVLSQNSFASFIQGGTSLNSSAVTSLPLNQNSVKTNQVLNSLPAVQNDGGKTLGVEVPSYRPDYINSADKPDPSYFKPMKTYDEIVAAVKTPAYATLYLSFDTISDSNIKLVKDFLDLKDMPTEAVLTNMTPEQDDVLFKTPFKTLPEGYMVTIDIGSRMSRAEQLSSFPSVVFYDEKGNRTVYTRYDINKFINNQKMKVQDAKK